MTEEQKEFTVKEIEKYNEKAKSKSTEAHVSMITGIGMLGIFASYHYSIEMIGGVVSLIAALCDFSFMIGCFAKRTGLESVARNLQYQLDMANLENQSDDYIYDSEEKGPRL